MCSPVGGGKGEQEEEEEGLAATGEEEGVATREIHTMLSVY